MKIDWSFSAQTMLDQLPLAAQTSVLDSLAHLEDSIAPDAPLPDELKLVGERSKDRVYSYLAVPEWRLAISESGQGLRVIDVARPDQMGSLRHLAHQE